MKDPSGILARAVRAPSVRPAPTGVDVDARGLWCGLGAYGLWGFMPLYFRLVREAPALELLAHRAVWLLLFLLAWLAVTHRWSALRDVLANRRARWGLLLTGVLIGSNWLIFTWAVTNERVIQASLGYFINPMVSVALGALVLRERPRRLQWIGIGIAGAGVAVLVILQKQLPLISLSLAITFALYALLRKQIGVDSLSGLTVETLLMAPLAAGAMFWWAAAGQLVFLHSRPALDALLLLAGVITGVPLLLFGAAARRLPLTLLGLMQYTAPSLQFLLGLWFGEPMHAAQWLSFACIWLGLAAFSADLVLAWRSRARQAAA